MNSQPKLQEQLFPCISGSSFFFRFPSWAQLSTSALKSAIGKEQKGVANNREGHPGGRPGYFSKRGLESRPLEDAAPLSALFHYPVCPMGLPTLLPPSELHTALCCSLLASAELPAD